MSVLVQSRFSMITFYFKVIYSLSWDITLLESLGMFCLTSQLTGQPFNSINWLVKSLVKSKSPILHPNNEGDFFTFPAFERCRLAIVLGERKWGRNKNRRFSTALVEPSARGYSHTDDWTGLVPVRETGSCLYTNRHFFNATSRPQQGVTRQSYRLHFCKFSQNLQEEAGLGMHEEGITITPL